MSETSTPHIEKWDMSKATTEFLNNKTGKLYTIEELRKELLASNNLVIQSGEDKQNFTTVTVISGARAMSSSSSSSSYSSNEDDDDDASDEISEEVVSDMSDTFDDDDDGDDSEEEEEEEDDSVVTDDIRESSSSSEEEESLSSIDIHELELELDPTDEDYALYKERTQSDAEIPSLNNYKSGDLVMLKNCPNKRLADFVGTRLFRIRAKEIDDNGNVHLIILSHVFSPFEYRIKHPFFYDWELYTKNS